MKKNAIILLRLPCQQSRKQKTHGMDKQKRKEVPTRPKEGDSKMSGEKDKSKTHKLSLKGNSPHFIVYEWHPNFGRVVQDGGRFCMIHIMTFLNIV